MDKLERQFLTLDMLIDGSADEDRAYHNRVVKQIKIDLKILEYKSRLKGIANSGFIPQRRTVANKRPI